MSAAFNREENIFHEAIQLTDAVQRRRFLDEACAGDPAMRAGVEGLLAAHVVAAQFFEDGEASLKKSRNESAAIENSSARLPLEEQLGARIGHYKLLQKIGEGGCGTV